MSTHSLYAPSGMHRKALCPASHQAEIPYPDTSGPSAIDGTHTHTLLEACIKNNQLPSAAVGLSMQDHDGEFVVDKERAERVQVAIDYIETLDAEVHSERLVNPGGFMFRDDYKGTADLVILHKSGLFEIADYKDGGMPVSPKKNPQGISYLLGGLFEYQIFDSSRPARFTIIQPKAMGVTHWDTTVGELLDKYLPQMAKVIEACEAQDPEFNPGDEQCQFCKHKRNCKARQELSMKISNQALSGISAPLPPTLPPIANMSNAELADVMDAANIVRGWLKDAEEESLSRVEKGQTVPRYKMIQKSGRRAWVDDTELVFKKLTALTHNQEKIWGKRDLVVEKPISFTKVLGEPKLSEAQRKRIEATLIKSPQGKKVLVPVTQGGKDISPAALLADLPKELPQQQNPPTTH